MTDQRGTGPALEDPRVSSYTIPAGTPESDRTLKWDRTTMVLVEVSAGGKDGFGCSYAGIATAKLIEKLLAKKVSGRNAFDIPGANAEMAHAIR
jgi:hypothetical protein